jgi:hypothetical protein
MFHYKNPFITLKSFLLFQTASLLRHVLPIFLQCIRWVVFLSTAHAKIDRIWPVLPEPPGLQHSTEEV